MCEHVEAWTLESACIVLYKSWHACGYASSCVLCVIFKIYHISLYAHRPWAPPGRVRVPGVAGRPVPVGCGHGRECLCFRDDLAGVTDNETYTCHCQICCCNMSMSPCPESTCPCLQLYVHAHVTMPMSMSMSCVRVPCPCPCHVMFVTCDHKQQLTNQTIRP